MAKCRLTGLVIGACLLLLSIGPCRAEGPDYAWPMVARPALTSTFGEYRDGRLHAGIDLKTWGREGYPVVAVADGSVWRVRTSPWGYGKAVYLKLADGRTAVYAHLSVFAPAISAVVEGEQERRGTYSVNLFLKPGRIPVRKGETVGFSGSTGIGVPHFHFEIRDEEQRPLNALTHGFSVPDTIPPTILALALVPMDADAQVEGGHEPCSVGVRWSDGQQRYRSGRRVTVGGRFGVAVQVTDRADASALTNRLAPHRLQLLVDGREVFQTTYTSLDYDRIHQGDLDRNMPLNRRGLGTYHTLYRATGNELPLYGRYRMGDGVLNAGRRRGRRGVALEPGQHLLRVVAEDVAGNRTEADLTVHVRGVLDVLGTHAKARGDLVVVSARLMGNAATVDVIAEASEDSGRTWRGGTVQSIAPGREVSLTVSARPGGIYRIRAVGPGGHEAFQTCAPVESSIGAATGDMLGFQIRSYPGFAVIEVESDRILSGPPRIRGRWPRGKERTLAVRQCALRSYEAVLRFEAGESGPITVTISAVDLAGQAGHGTMSVLRHRVTREGGTVQSSDGLAEARFDPDGVYERFFAKAEEQDLPGPEGLPSIGRAYRFTPEDVPFNRQATVAIRYPLGLEHPERLGIYEFDADSSWTFLGNEQDAVAGTVAAEVWHFSTYGLLLDEIPPVVTDLRPALDTETGDRRPRLEAELRDQGSGIGREEDISVALDGRALVFEFDPEEERLTAQPKRPLRPGVHRLEITARDMCGNETRDVSVFTVR